MQPSFIQRFGTYFTLFFILVGAAATGAYFYQHTFRGLSPEALDSAQLARNIFRGAGFSSNILPPETLIGSAKARVFNPELGQGPLFPLLLGSTFAFAGERDGVVAKLSLALFLGTTIALFFLTLRLTRSTPLAATSALAFIFSRVVLGLGISGQPQALSSFFLLLTLLALTPKNSGAAETAASESEAIVPDEYIDEEAIEEETPEEREWRERARLKRLQVEAELAAEAAAEAAANGETPFPSIVTAPKITTVTASEIQTMPVTAEPENDEIAAKPRRASGYFLAGLFAALCYLSDPLAIVPLLFLLVSWGRGLEGWKRPAVFSFGLGLLLLVLPWWVRNARLTRDPFFSTQWLAPGAGSGFLGFDVNLLHNAPALLSGIAVVPHVFLAPFVVVSPWMRPLSAPLARLRSATLWSLLGTIAVLSALGHSEVELLLPFAPLLTLLGIVTFRQMVGDAFSRRLQGGIVSGAAGLSLGARLWVLILTICGLRQAKAEFLARRNYQSQVEAQTGEASLDSGRLPRARATLAVSLLCLLLLLAAPLIALPTAPDRPDARTALEPLGKIVPLNGAILTDAPEGIAWYGDRNVVPLPDDVKIWFDTANNKTNAIYLLGQNGGLSTASTPQWREVAARGLDLPGYRKISGNGATNLVYIRELTLDEARAAVKAKPKDVAVAVALGNVLIQKRDFTGALAVFQNAIPLAPKSGDGYYGLGLAYLGLNNPDAARSQFDKALKIAPRSVATLLQLAGLEQVKTDKRAAIALYERVLADVPNSAIALNNLANLYAEGDDKLFRALEMARRAAVQNPTNGSIIDTLGWVCFRLGYQKEALTYLKRANELDPHNKNIAAHLQQAQGAPASAIARQ